jgi:Ser/Thr protein kinase RdoA (MazF antagonist)
MSNNRTNLIETEKLIELNKALQHWNISSENIKQIYSSAWQIGDKYILKTGNNIDNLINNLTIIKALSEQKIPVAEIIQTAKGEDYILDGNTYFFLSKRIAGEHIADIYADDYQEMAYIIGRILGKLHLSFRVCQDKISFYDNNFYEEINGWVLQTLQHKNISYVPEALLKECVSKLENLYPKLPRQLIHRDIHLGNMLFKDNTLTGYIDFDLSQINARIFDLCYMLLGFLIDNTENEDKTTKWFEILHRLVSGYSSILQLTVEEKAAVPIIMLSIELLFVAYFESMDDSTRAAGSAKILIWLWKNQEKLKLEGI